MAIAFVNSGAKATDSNSPFSVTPDLPASMQADDIVLLMACVANGQTASISANGSVSSWTLITGLPISTTGSDVLYVWWGRYSSGSTGPTVAGSTSADHLIASTAAYRGCQPSGAVIDNQTTGSETTSDTSFSFVTGISTTINNSMVLVVCSSTADSNTGQYSSGIANANLSSINVRNNVNTNAGDGGGHWLAEGLLASAGAIGTWSATMGSNTAKGYVTFNLKPSMVINVHDHINKSPDALA